jgi:hypothetical protein
MAGEIVVGAVAVDIVPSAKNFLPRLLKEIAPAVAQVSETASKTLEKELADGTSEGIKKGLKDGKGSAAKDGEDAGEKFSGGFAAAVKSGMAAVQAAIGSVSIKAEADTTEARQELIGVKKQVAEFRDKTINIDLDAAQFFTQATGVKAALAALTANQEIDLGIGSEIRNAARSVDELVEKIQSANTQTGAFARKVDDYFKQFTTTLTDVEFDFAPHFDDGELTEGIKQVKELRDLANKFRQENASGLLTGDEIIGQLDKINAAFSEADRGVRREPDR